MSEQTDILKTAAKEELRQLDDILTPVMTGGEITNTESLFTIDLLNRELADQEEQAMVAEALAKQDMWATARVYSVIQESQRLRRDVNISRSSRKKLWFSQLATMYQRKRQLTEKAAKGAK